MKLSDRFKDQCYLLICGIVVAMACAVFFKYTGHYGSVIMTAITVVGLIVDNVQLRKKLKLLSQGK